MNQKRPGLFQKKSIVLADAPTPPEVTSQGLQFRVIMPDERISGFLGYMPNPDEVLVDTWESINVYRKMRTDARIKSLLKVLKSSVTNYPLRLDSTDIDQKVQDLVESALKVVPLSRVSQTLLSAIDYGYSVSEVIWESHDGWWMPKTLYGRKPERFVFDSAGNPKLRSFGIISDLSTQAFKWLHWSYDSDAENPYGTSVLQSCYWPWKFKKAGLEFWLMAAEKFAVPSLLALFESNESPEKARERAQDIAAMLMQNQSGSGAALANIKDVKVLEAGDNLTDFKVLMDWCDTQIAYAIVSQSLAVQEAENGTRAQAQVHEGTFEETAKDICRQLAEPLQRYIDAIVSLNFGQDIASPRVLPDIDDFAPWTTVKDALEHGIPVSKSALYDRYGLPEPEDEKDVFLSIKAPAADAIATPGPTEVAVAPGASTEVQSTALNGAQITSLVDLAAKVAAGELPLESARSIARASFPLVKPEAIDAIFAPLQTFKASANLADTEHVKKNSRPVILLKPRS